MDTIRLGFTETTLLFFWYLDKKIIDNKCYFNDQCNLLNWLCSTSGFYDKEIIGSYFDFDTSRLKYNKTYNKYFKKLFHFLKDNNSQIELCFHEIDELQFFKEKFLKKIGFKNISKTSYNSVKNYDALNNLNNLNSFMSNKNILIINNLGSLMKQQFDSGNIQKINPDFPTTVKSIQYFENGYTFFNNGPDGSILETAEKNCDEIKKYTFDAAIISAGAYSCLIGEFIVNKLKKNIFIIGRHLPVYFGIITKGTKSDQINEYFIQVPEQMRPLGYEKIENGCYW